MPAETAPKVVPSVVAEPVIDSASVSAETTQKMVQFEERLTAIEGSLADIKSLLASQDVTTEIAALKTSLSEVQEKLRTQDNAKARAAAAQDVQRGYDAPRRVATKPAQVVQPSRAIVWQLKSAKPGKAWLSANGSSEMTMVQTGDLLPGVGRVTAIDRDANGRWFVEAGNRRIAQ